MSAKRTRQWSIPLVMNIVWVLVAFLLTIIDSFVDFNYFITVPGDAGYSIAAVWTYLLPLVIGWLHVGSQPEANHLRDGLENAHSVAYVATTSEPVLATRADHRFTRAIEASTEHINHINADEKKTAPIFNYSRVFVWSQSAECILKLYQHAAAKAERRITVQRGREWMNNNDGTSSTNNRIGNETEVMQYCMAGLQAPVYPNPGGPQPIIPIAPYSAFPPSLKSSATTSPTDNMYPYADGFVHGPLLAPLSGEDEETGVIALPEKPVFAAGVIKRVAFATALALGLQWGTTGAAILIHLNTPPKGIGCRATTFTVYGAAATAVFWLLLFSSTLGHLARRQSMYEKQSGWKTFAGYTATLTRWLGKLVAIMNGFGILISCILQFAGVYDSCFCSSSIFGGSPNGVVSFTEENVTRSEVHMYWIGGIVMAFGVSGVYTSAIYLATPIG